MKKLITIETIIDGSNHEFVTLKLKELISLEVSTRCKLEACESNGETKETKHWRKLNEKLRRLRSSLNV